MVYGVLQLINFAHSEVFMYGTFASPVDGDGCSCGDNGTVSLDKG